jgi:hypothetical protein
MASATLLTSCCSCPGLADDSEMAMRMRASSKTAAEMRLIIGAILTLRMESKRDEERLLPSK